MAGTVIPLDRPMDLRSTFGVTGLKGPTQRVAEGGMWRSSRTPDGPATIRMSIADRGLSVDAWGDGTDWVMDRIEMLTGAADDGGSVVAHHEQLVPHLKAARGMRLPAVGVMVEVLIPVILAQKVTGILAGRNYRGLIRRYGGPAPGPLDLPLPPDPARLAVLPYYDYHPLGIEQKRASIVQRVCREADRLQRAADADLEAARATLLGLRGIGQWTVGRTMLVVQADPDAVPIGDYHVPNSVTWALAGEPRGTDERMMELLEPYTGQRGRVARIIERFAGHAPKYGPKKAPRSFERH